jgi:hypothetical protein
MKTRLVFNIPIARQLMRRGNVVIKTMPNKKDNDLIVFVFLEDEKFINDFQEVLNEYKKDKKGSK